MSDRKYSQRGYQDDDSRPARNAPHSQRPEKMGPGGRGLGAPTRSVFRCRDCGAEQSLFEQVALDATCEGCGADLHSCVNCGHFDTSYRYECRQKISQPMRSKTKANDCEQFSEKLALESDGSASSDPDDPRAAFDALFR
jgi:hypothetical protein